jgi:oxygen-dependent protoporphyrinogen oxidase
VTADEYTGVGVTADVIVVGAGLSGLATAFGLQQRGYSVLVLEAAERAGGVIGSRRRDGALFETGPNSALDSTPLIDTLVTDLGIASERGYANVFASTRFIVRGGQLVPLPRTPVAFLTTPVLSFSAKWRLLHEPFIAPAPSDVEESIAAFARRRFGDEVADYAVDPFVAGIYAGDPDEISVAAAFPRLHSLEQRNGSLVKGFFRDAQLRTQNEQTRPIAASFSFRNGMQTLTDALARASARTAFGVTIDRIARNDDGSIGVAGTRAGAPFTQAARAVVIATPAYAAAPMVAGLAPKGAQALTAIQYAPIAVVASVYRRADITHSLAGFGFLVPKKERRNILGSLFSSSLFADRVPEGTVLLTSFAGGRRDPAMMTLADDAIAQTVHDELASLVGATARPLWQEVVRWPRAIPQYTLGHLDRLREVEAAETALPGLHFCASYRGGVSVGDCIKSAHATTENVDRSLHGR